MDFSPRPDASGLRTGASAPVPPSVPFPRPTGGHSGSEAGSPRGRVLVVEDDATVAEVVAGYLGRAGHAVELAADGDEALQLAARQRPDLVVLDLMLPGVDGLEVCRRLRESGPVPVIMLTARADEQDRILGLEHGADDYVTKPFSPRELVLRVASVLRRSQAAAEESVPVKGLLRHENLTVDPVARRATRDSAELALTVREFDLLVFLLRHPGQVFERERLMREVWGWEFGDLSTVTVHIRRLRAKIEQDAARPRLIRTVWGVGYRLEAETGPSGRAGPSDREPGPGSGPRSAPGPHEQGPGSSPGPYEPAPGELGRHQERPR